MNEEKSSLIFLHSLKFSSDFIEAKEKFQDDIEHDDLDVDNIYQNLSDMINDNPKDLKGKKNEEIKSIDKIFTHVKIFLQSREKVFDKNNCIPRNSTSETHAKQIQSPSTSDESSSTLPYELVLKTSRREKQITD